VVVSASRAGRRALFTTLLAPARDSEPVPSLLACARGRAVVSTTQGLDVLSWSDREAELA
jgi:hypothetical protein